MMTQTGHNLMKLWMQQLLVCADNVILLGENINTMNKNKEALSDTTKDVGLEAKTTKYMLMPCHQNVE
jgi:hypothetical protein